MKSCLGFLVACSLVLGPIVALASPLDDFRAYVASHPTATAKDVCKELRRRLGDAETMFRAASVDQPPKGDTYGCVVGFDSMPGLLSKMLAKTMNVFWKGKKFNDEGTALVNKIPALGPIGLHETASAEVILSKSRLDGQDIYVLDYDESQLNLPIEEIGIRSIRDEIREISPGIFLGPVYTEIAGAPFATTLYFAVFTEKSGLTK